MKKACAHGLSTTQNRVSITVSGRRLHCMYFTGQYMRIRATYMQHIVVFLNVIMLFCSWFYRIKYLCVTLLPHAIFLSFFFKYMYQAMRSSINFYSPLRNIVCNRHLRDLFVCFLQQLHCRGDRLLGFFGLRPESFQWTKKITSIPSKCPKI